MLELIVGILLATGATYYVLRPILRPTVPALGRVTSGDDEGDDPDDDLSPQAVALRALKEIEFDRATGKLSDADYDDLHAKYQAAALAALRHESAPSAVRRAPEDAPRAPLTAHGARCPVDGPRPERDAVFCSACGRRLGGGGGPAAGYCTRCGTALETDARYCSRCGSRVAA